MSTVGDRILFMRKQLGLTQEELAKKMGYKSKSTINKIELGINDIPQSKIFQFAEVLDTTPAFLMGWDEEEKISPNEPTLTEGEKMVLELFRKIPEDRQAEALELLRVALRMQKKL
jgi:transcriptional regulator with XRE-family HTH domain